MVRPTDLITPRPDNSNRVDKVEQANTRQLALRSQLPADQTRLTFQLVADTRTSAFGHVYDPLDPGEEQSFYVSETGSPMPYQPPAERNITITQIANSTRGPARINAYVNGQLFAASLSEGGNFNRKQLAALAELKELVTDLDGSNTIEYTLENLSDQHTLEASVQIRAIQVVEQ
jgi:hypothetical protein